MKFNDKECCKINIKKIMIANIDQFDIADEILYIIDLKFEYDFNERLVYKDVETRNTDYAILCEEMDKCQK